MNLKRGIATQEEQVAKQQRPKTQNPIHGCDKLNSASPRLERRHLQAGCTAEVSPNAQTTHPVRP